MEVVWKAEYAESVPCLLFFICFHQIFLEFREMWIKSGGHIFSVKSLWSQIKEAGMFELVDSEAVNNPCVNALSVLWLYGMAAMCVISSHKAKLAVCGFLIEGEHFSE